MTVPINRLKLVAFASGAAIAGLAGSMFASFQLGVYPLNFQVQFLIVVYAALILGGSGSLSGAVPGVWSWRSCSTSCGTRDRPARRSTASSR